MNELSLFTGAGGGVLGTQHLLGWRSIGYVEYEGYCQEVLKARIRDGILHDAPIFGDIREFISSGCAEAYRGVVDVITGGFPCQDISAAGNRKGLGGKKSGLWKSMLDAIRIIRPRYVFVENSPELVRSGIGVILSDLAAIGFDAQWMCLRADSLGATHRRDRVWIVANSVQERCRPAEQKPFTKHADMGNNIIADGIYVGAPIRFDRETKTPQGEMDIETAICGINDAMADWMDRLAAIGNGQVPIVAATAWRLLADAGV